MISYPRRSFVVRPVCEDVVEDVGPSGVAGAVL